ncbi:MAG TPA: squalene/phytoene synthase family protein, partial [Gammaproteobacteria bacterium]
MPDPDQYAAELAVALRDDWQFSRIFAKAKARPGFTALLALRVELQRVATTSEPGITAMKFEWWRNEIERGFAAEAQHPLVHALGKHLGKAGCAPEYCLELVDAAETESGFPAGFSEQDFQLYLYRSGGVLAELLAQLSGVTDRAALDAARRLGQTKRFSDLLLSTGVMLRAERWLFPARWLADAGLTLQELQAGEGSTAATRAL